MVAPVFGAELAAELREEEGGADLIVGNNVLAHVPALRDFVAGLAILLAPSGVVTMEFPHLLRLVATCARDGPADRLDDIDPRRRFEAAFPALGTEIAALLESDTEAAARGLLDLAERRIAPQMTDWPTEAAGAIRRFIEG